MKLTKKNVKKIHSNPRFDVIETTYAYGDKEYPYYTIGESNGFVVVLGVDNDKIMITKQYRPPINRVSYEFVGGYIEDGEEPIEAAKREFLEESGYLCKSLFKLGSIKAGVNKTNSTGHVFVGKDFEKRTKSLDEFETIVGLESTWVPLDKIADVIKRGFIVDTTTLAAWALYCMER